MKVCHGLEPRPAFRAPSVAIGNFDGAHVGHQRIFAFAVEGARARGADAVVLTFDPHPAKVLAPELAPPLIVPLWRKLELLEASGLDGALVLPFTPELAALSPEAFVDRILVDALGAREVVVGYDFTFGKGRSGTVETLRALGETRGFTVRRVEAQTVGGLVASSTKVREFVLEGRVDGAARLLGRELELLGEVVHGEERGRTLGFPTANVAVENELWPREGVYAARVRVLTGPHAGWTGGAALNIGTNPTFTAERPGAAARRSVEAFLLDFTGELYGARLSLGLVERIRGEQRFPSAEALIAQIKNDVQSVRDRLARGDRSPARGDGEP